jgi:hypothetical protein
MNEAFQLPIPRKVYWKNDLCLMNNRRDTDGSGSGRSMKNHYDFGADSNKSSSGYEERRLLLKNGVF